MKFDPDSFLSNKTTRCNMVWTTKENAMECKVTANGDSKGMNRHFGIARSLVATGTEEQIRRWASKWSSRGFGVTINPPAGKRAEWQAAANRTHKADPHLEYYGVAS